MIKLIIMTMLWCTMPYISIAVTNNEVVKGLQTEGQPVKSSRQSLRAEISMLRALLKDNSKINLIISQYNNQDMGIGGYLADIIESIEVNAKGFYGLFANLSIMTGLAALVKIFSSLWISYQAVKAQKNKESSFQELGVVATTLLNIEQGFSFLGIMTLLMMTSLPDIHTYTLSLTKVYNWFDVLSMGMNLYTYNKVLRHAEVHRQLRDRRMGLASIINLPKTQIFLRYHKTAFLRNLSAFATIVAIASPLVTVFRLMGKYAHKQEADRQQTLSLVGAMTKIASSFSFLYIMWSTLKASSQLSLACQKSKTPLQLEGQSQPETQEATKNQAAPYDQAHYMKPSFLVKSRYLHALLNSVSFALSCYEKGTIKTKGIMEFVLLIATVMTEGGQLFALTHRLNKVTRPLQAGHMRGEF